MSTNPDTSKRCRLSYESIQAQAAAAKPYRPASQYSVIMEALLDRNQIREIHLAEQMFMRKRWLECTQLCEYFIQAQPSEAVKAKAHTMLVVRGVGLAMEARRKYHAEEAIRLWTVAIERTGTSKFDVEKAKEQQKITEEAFRAMRIIGPERDDTPRYREVYAEDSE